METQPKRSYKGMKGLMPSGKISEEYVNNMVQKLSGTEQEACVKKYIEDAKAKELRKAESGTFWQNVIKGVNTVGGLAKDYTTTSTGQNVGEWEKTRNDDLPPAPQETRILGMKPLVFTVVALGTVTTLAIVTVLLMRKGKK